MLEGDGDLEALLAVVAFLTWLRRDRPRAIWGGFSIDEVVEAFRHLTGLSDEDMRRITDAER